MMHHYIICNDERAWLYCDGEWVPLWGDTDAVTIIGWPPDNVYVSPNVEDMPQEEYAIWDFSDRDIKYINVAKAGVIPYER